MFFFIVGKKFLPIYQFINVSLVALLFVQYVRVTDHEIEIQLLLFTQFLTGVSSDIFPMVALLAYVSVVTSLLASTQCVSCG